MTGIPTVDLFAGAGGLSIGASRAGADVRLAVDIDALACETLRRNHARHNARVLLSDVTLLAGGELRAMAGIARSDPLVVVGGAPCQPFSKAAYWLDSGAEARYRRARARGQEVRRPVAAYVARPDARRDLIDEFMRLVVESSADAFLLENVPSVLHPRNRAIIAGVTCRAETEGYQVTVARVNAAEFGVAQRRHRVVVMGSRGGRPIAPPATHSLDAMSTELPRVRTAGEAILALRDPGPFEPEETVKGRWADHLRSIPPGWNYKFHTAWAGHPAPSFETETRFWNFLLKLDPDRPSWTIAANPGPWTGPFHWDNRRLRTVELAVLQGFPEGHEFAGGRRDRVRQIGNAVPPAVAEAAVRELLATIGAAVRGAA